MSSTWKKLVFWSPRILTLAVAAFLSIFALDVLGMEGSLPMKLAGLFIHLIPTWLVLIALVVAWRREWVGAALFPLLAVAHLASKWGQLDMAGYAVIEIPLLALGALFWISWAKRAELRPTPV